MTISRRDIAIILPIAILSVALAQAAHAEALQQAPSNWDFGPRVQWFLGAAVIPIAGAAVLLFFAAKHPARFIHFQNASGLLLLAGHDLHHAPGGGGHCLQYLLQESAALPRRQHAADRGAVVRGPWGGCDQPGRRIPME